MYKVKISMKLKEPNSTRRQRETALALLAQSPYTRTPAAFTGMITPPAPKLQGGLFAALKNLFTFKRPTTRLALIPRRP